jgi:hypothetical protein
VRRLGRDGRWLMQKFKTPPVGTTSDATSEACAAES